MASHLEYLQAVDLRLQGIAGSQGDPTRLIAARAQLTQHMDPQQLLSYTSGLTTSMRRSLEQLGVIDQGERNEPA